MAYLKDAAACLKQAAAYLSQPVFKEKMKHVAACFQDSGFSVYKK